MFGTKRRTYASKKSESGSIKHKDILLSVPDTNLFNALSAINIKKYRKDNSYLFPNRISTLSTGRTKPAVGTKRILLEISNNSIKNESKVLDSSSDTSFHVKHNSNDLFDQLKNSTTKNDETFSNLINDVNVVETKNVDPRINLSTDSSSYSPIKENTPKNLSFKLDLPRKKKSHNRKRKTKPKLNLTSNGNTSHSINEFNFVVEPCTNNASIPITPEAILKCKNNWSSHEALGNLTTTPHSHTTYAKKYLDDSVPNFETSISNTLLPSSTPYEKKQFKEINQNEDSFNLLNGSLCDAPPQVSLDIDSVSSNSVKDEWKVKKNSVETLNPKLLMVPHVVLERIHNQSITTDGNVFQNSFTKYDSYSDTSFRGFTPKSQNNKRPEMPYRRLLQDDSPLMFSPDLFSVSSFDARCEDSDKSKIVTIPDTVLKSVKKKLELFENENFKLLALGTEENSTENHSLKQNGFYSPASQKQNESNTETASKSSNSVVSMTDSIKEDLKLTKMIPVVLIDKMNCNKSQNETTAIHSAKHSYGDVSITEFCLRTADNRIISNKLLTKDAKCFDKIPVVVLTKLNSEESSLRENLTKKYSPTKVSKELTDEKLTKTVTKVILFDIINLNREKNTNVDTNNKFHHNSPMRLRNKKTILRKNIRNIEHRVTINGNKVESNTENSESINDLVEYDNRLDESNEKSVKNYKTVERRDTIKDDTLESDIESYLSTDNKINEIDFEEYDKLLDNSNEIAAKYSKNAERRVIIKDDTLESEFYISTNDKIDFQEYDKSLNDSNEMSVIDSKNIERRVTIKDGTVGSDTESSISTVNKTNEIDYESVNDSNEMSVIDSKNIERRVSTKDGTVGSDTESSISTVNKTNEIDYEESVNDSNEMSVIDSKNVECSAPIKDSKLKLDVSLKRNFKVGESNESSIDDSSNQSLFNNTCMLITKRDLTDKSLQLNSPENHNLSNRYPIESYTFDNRMIDMTKRDAMYKKTVAPRPSICLEPGKRWERSLNILRNMNKTNLTINDSINGLNSTVVNNGANKGRMYNLNVTHLLEMQNPEGNRNSLDGEASHYFQNLSRRYSVMIVEEPTLCEESLEETQSSVSSGLYTDSCNDTAISLSRVSLPESDRSKHRSIVLKREAHLDVGGEEDVDQWDCLSARDIVLRRCNQSEPLPFDVCYPPEKLRKCQKIGEGVYGEVFLYKNEEDPLNPIVMKVIPIEGELLVNGDRQKTFGEIISEIIIAMELSDLRNNKENSTCAFNKVNRVRCVQGRYPESLIDLWELYDELKGSENDNPTIFDINQLYIVLELANGGNDLEAFRFKDAEQSYYLFFQVVFALAVAEESFQFEHRDLHWGNILISNCDQESLKYKLRGEEFTVPTGDIKCCVIDYTLSRITLPAAHLSPARIIYNDLSKDPDLFNADGDYQFDIYRLMKEKNSDSWQHFEPFTNILWLHYTLDKMITALRYDRADTRIHEIFISKLNLLKDAILQYDSCVDFVTSEQCFSLLHET